MVSTPKYITANIQGMFNLEKLIAEAYAELGRIASLPDDEFNDDVFSIQDAHLARLPRESGFCTALRSSCR